MSTKFTMPPYAIEQFRTVTNSRVPMTHIRKKCKCGVVVTAKQIAQYGKCDKCKAAK